MRTHRPVTPPPLSPGHPGVTARTRPLSRGASMSDLVEQIRRDREAGADRWHPCRPECVTIGCAMGCRGGGLRSDTCAAGAPGVAVRMDPRVVDGQMRRIAQEADAGTITPPVTIEPVLEPHPADHRLAAAEHALIAIRRQALAQAQDAKATAEWATNALHHIRKARGR